MFYLQPSGLFSALHPHHNSQLPPFEFLQSWTGSFAGITSPEIKALLLSLMTGGQGRRIRRALEGVLKSSLTQPNPSLQAKERKRTENRHKQTYKGIQEQTKQRESS